MSNELVVVIVKDESKLNQSELALIGHLTQEFKQRKTEIKLISVEKFLEMDSVNRPWWLAGYSQDTTVTFLPLCRGFELNDGAINETVQMLTAKPQLVDSTAVAVFPSGIQTQLQIQNGLSAYLSMILGDDEADFALKKKLVERVARLDINNYEETLTVLKEILRQLPEKKTLRNIYGEQPVAEASLVKKTKEHVGDAGNFVSKNAFNIAFALISAGTVISIDRSSSLALIYYGLFILGASGVIGAKRAFPQVFTKVHYLAETGAKSFLNASHEFFRQFVKTNDRVVRVLDAVERNVDLNSEAFRKFMDDSSNTLRESSQVLLNQIELLREDATGQTQILLDNVSRAIKRAGDLTEDNLREARSDLNLAFENLRKDFNRRGEHIGAVLENQMNRLQNTLDKGVGLVGQAANVGARGVADGARDAGIGARAAGEGIGRGAEKAGDGISKAGDGISKVGDAAKAGKLKPEASLCTIL